MSTSPVLVRPVRSINGIFADAVIEERHHDSSVITRHPVEVGSTISDHIYSNPSELILTYVWTPGGQQNKGKDPTFLKTTYQKFLDLKAAATLMQVITGKRSYNNMAIEELYVTTDYTSENILELRIQLLEILLATTQVVPITPAVNQLLPQLTQSVQNGGQLNLQDGTNFNSSKGPPTP